MIVRFGPFELDRSAGELRRDGVRLRLQDKPLRVLDALIERPGALVTRDELRKRLWSDDTFVDFDNSLNNAISRLRAEPREMLATILHDPASSVFLCSDHHTCRARDDRLNRPRSL